MKEKVIAILAAHDSLRGPVVKGGASPKEEFAAYLHDVFTKAEESAAKVATHAATIADLVARIEKLEAK